MCVWECVCVCVCVCVCLCVCVCVIVYFRLDWHLRAGFLNFLGLTHLFELSQICSRQLFPCRTTHCSTLHTLQHTGTQSGCNALQHRAASGSCRLSTWHTARQGSKCLSSDCNVPLQYRAATHGCKCLSPDVYVPL